MEKTISYAKSNVLNKAFNFSVDVVKTCKALKSNNIDDIMVKQLLRSGTSIAANLEEGVGASTRKEFSYKISSSYREARESKYWIQLIYLTNGLEKESFNRLFNKSDELCRILYSIQKSMNQRIEK